MSTDMRFDKIKNVFVSDSTARSSTEEYIEYLSIGTDEEFNGSNFYKAGQGIGVYPTPTSDEESRAIKVIYETVPPVFSSTTDTTSVPRISNDYAKILQWNTLKEVAGAGHSPDVEMRNNFESEFQSLLKKLKMDYYKNKQKNSKDKFSYKSGW
jgi:hypothetical protein